MWYSFSTPSDESSLANDEGPATDAELAQIAALNEELFSTGFEGSPEENMREAKERLGLSDGIFKIPGHVVIFLSWPVAAC